MKNITKSLIALFAVLAISCTVADVQDRPVIAGIDAPVLTAPTTGAAYVLKPENAAQQIERFTWTTANFGGAVEITYAVQIDKKGNNFASPQILGSVISGNQVAASVEVMNNASLALKATPFAIAQYEVRVKATVGANNLFSNVVSISITPYTTESPKLWVAGSYQAASGYTNDWSPADAPKLMAEGYGKTAFEGYVYFNGAGNYKLTSKANWDGPNYGAGASASLISATGGDIPMAAAGYYYIKADTDPTKLSLSATAQVWGIVGNATAGGWSTDTPMTYNKTTKKWTITAVLTAQSAPDNGLKFRANNNWDYNFGDTGADGKLEGGGTNIGTSAGTYLITLDLSNPRAYTYSLVKQ